MNHYLLVLPILVPLATAIITIFMRRHRQFQRMTSLGGALTLLVFAVLLLIEVLTQGIQVTQVGNWPAPFGITLVADLLSAIMLVLTGVIGTAVGIYSIASMDEERENYGYYTFFHLLLMGVSGAFLTGDIFNLYVWFEVMLMASFVLMALGGERKQMTGAITYVALNLISSSMFLAAIGILYGMMGTLNMADLAVKIQTLEVTLPSSNILLSVALLFLIAFGIKSAAFPLFFWLPASYHTPPPAISALFAGLLTKVGVYALIRVFTLIFIQDVPFVHHTLLLVIAGFTMVTGVLGAMSQNEFRRVLSFHIISQIGYMIWGLAMFTPLALAASVFYITHHIIVKTNLFLIGGLVERLRGTGELNKLGGLYPARATLSLLFLVPALSLAGIPPFSGFFAKLGLVQAGLANQMNFIVGVSLGVSLLTLFSMIKLWNEVFWKPAPAEAEPLVSPGSEVNPEQAAGGTSKKRPLRWFSSDSAWMIPIAGLAAITVIIGLGAGGVFALAMRAGEQLMNPAGYIQAVLGR